jgi:phosphoglucosamine mutase
MSIFGTDGVRGRAGEGLLTPEGARHVGQAFAMALDAPAARIAIARDTRESSAWLQQALVDGMLAGGAVVEDLGVLPTPALSWWIDREAGLRGGVMVTASHNPWQDNGIKLLGPDGTKASDALQDACEQGWRVLDGGGELPAPRSRGRMDRLARRARRAWSAALVVGHKGALAGRTIVYDDAAGAAAEVLGPVLEACGADVVALAPEPDGRNINAGIGAVHPDAAGAMVAERGAWAGVVVDGDADRVQLVDEAGAVHDGDAILGFLASRMAAEDALEGDAIVGTITTNGGLELFLKERGLGLHRADVGDRHVAALMTETGCNLGGEYSGHILMPAVTPTGDAIRTALLVLTRAAADEAPLSALLGAVPKFPSGYRKVPDGGNRLPVDRILADATIAPILDEVHGAGGRTLLRYSGTEPILRVQVEGRVADLVETWADRIAAATGALLAG